MKQTDQEQQVCDYLKRNPDFFQHHPYVLLELELFSKSQGLPNLALQQLRLLREQNQALKQQLSGMAKVAHSNEQIFKTLSDCQRQIWQASSLNEISKVIQTAFANTPNISATELLFQPEQVTQALNTTLEDKAQYLGRTPKQLDSVWEKAPSTGSVALYQLDDSDAVLAFASDNPAHFCPNNDDLLMQEFLAGLKLRIAALG